MAPWAAGVLVRVRVQKADGTWVDISDDVRTIERAAPIRAVRGRQNETDAIQPGSLQLTIDNSSGDYTPGRSAAACELTLGMPIVVDEGIGYRTWPAFTGLLQVPDSVEQIEGVDHLITVTAVDRQAALAGGRKFISTLAEHILYAGGSNLVAYWPLGEPSSARSATGVKGPEPLMTYSTADYVTPGSQAMPAGDDLSGPVFVDAGTLTPNTPMATGEWDTPIAITSSQTVTVAVWVRPAERAAGTTYADLLQISRSGTIFLGINWSSGFPVWNAGASDFGGGWGPILGVNGQPAVPGAWTLVAFRFGLRDTQELWVGQSAAQLSFGGGAPASATFDTITLSPLTHMAGAIAHLQIYTSSTTDYTRAMHLEQLSQGYAGLAQQTPGERIDTILDYASPSTRIPRALDEGSTYMQAARLAGKTPGQAIDEAVATERGRFFTSSDGISTFHARTRAYNL